MWLEFFQPRDFLLIQSVFVGTLILAIIIGATGPDTLFTVNFYSYNCSNGDHFTGPCEGGVELGLNPGQNNNVVFSNNDIDKPLSPYNSYVGIDIMPYFRGNESFSAQVLVDIDIKTGTKKADGTVVWGEYDYREDTLSMIDFVCSLGDSGQGGECNQANVVQLTRLSFEYYQITLHLRPLDENGVGYPWMSDVKVSAYSVNAAFTKFQLGFRITFAIIASGFFFYYLYIMRDAWAHDCFKAGPELFMAFEQKWLFVLLGVLIIYCDPFFAARTVAYGVFLEVLSVGFEVASDCVILMFWLVMLDTIKREESRLEMTWMFLPKLVMVGLYALFAVISGAWLRSRYSLNPVLGNDQTFNDQIFPLVVVSDIIFFLIIVWVVYLFITTYVEISSRRTLQLRFIHLGVPTIIYLVSDIVGVFIGGPLNNAEPTSLAFLYYFALQNAYVYALLAGYWPIFGRTTPIASQAVEVVDNADDEEHKSLVTVSPGTNPFAAVD